MTPQRLRQLAVWMDQYGLAQDLLDEKYQDRAVIQASTAHIAEVLEHFFAHVPLEDAWRGGQERGLPWGAVRSLDELLDDAHLRDREFFVEVELYPGAAAIYSASPWRISRRAPLIGEHNTEIFCGELGLRQEELVLLTEAGVV
jgi:crotonobetainyl-CoA:carnitine CoA-transferase CaiB-like acyl-CoA transferase